MGLFSLAAVDILGLAPTQRFQNKKQFGISKLLQLRLI